MQVKEIDCAWHLKYEVGLEEIDAQHQYLFGLIGELHSHADASVTDKTARDLLREIDRYCYYHFNSEEVLMEIYRYPALEQQKHEHFKLLQVLDKRICDFRQQGTTVRPISEFLHKWFLSHVLSEDCQMAKFIIEIRAARSGIPKATRFQSNQR